MNEAITQALDVVTIIAMYIDLEGEIYLNHTKIGDVVSTEDERSVNKKRIVVVMKKSFLKVVDDYSKKSTTK